MAILYQRDGQNWFGTARWRPLPPIDLSPLSKFIGKGREHVVKRDPGDYFRCVNCLGRVGLDYAVGDPCSGVAEMYGYDFTPPIPEPEKSPQEKALEDFIARREAKRKQLPPIEATVYGDASGNYASTEKEYRRMMDLDRAMSKLIPAEKAFRERLVNVKVAM